MELRWGYTLADIDQFARIANRTVWTTAGDDSDRFETAWHGVVEALCAAEHWIPRHTLISAGQRAVLDMIGDHLRHHGWHRGQRRAVFETYWADWLHFRSTSPEAGVVERVALMQVFVCLSPRQRKALLALAACGDYASAATAAGMSRSLLTVTLSNARRRFIALWMEGETPTKRREHYNRRPTSKPGGVKPCGTYPAYHRHRMRKEVPCDPCKQAYREYRQMLKERAKD
jgi:hypothetical protein